MSSVLQACTAREGGGGGGPSISIEELLEKQLAAAREMMHQSVEIKRRLKSMRSEGGRPILSARRGFEHKASTLGRGGPGGAGGGGRDSSMILAQVAQVAQATQVEKLAESGESPVKKLAQATQLDAVYKATQLDKVAEVTGMGNVGSSVGSTVRSMIPPIPFLGLGRKPQRTEAPDSDRVDRLDTPLVKKESKETGSRKSTVANELSAKRDLEQNTNKACGVEERVVELLSDGYKDRGCFQAIVRSMAFEYATFLVIALNTIWIAIDTEYNKWSILCEAPLPFQIVTNVFCSFFTFEILVRVLALKRKCKALRDFQFMFDLFLVLIMIWEAWVQVWLYKHMRGIAYTPTGSHRYASVFRIFRLFRLARIFRAMKLVDSLPEFMILAKGIVAAMRSAVSTLGALGLVIYVFGILFVQLLRGSDSAASRFESVPMAMNFLLMQVICGLDADTFMDLLTAGWWYYVLYLLFVFIAQMTIMNMLVGVVVDVVSKVGDDEREKAQNKLLSEYIDTMVKQLDTDETGGVALHEFDKLILNPGTLMKLKSLDVDIISFVQFTRNCFPDNGELSADDFTQIMLMFMGAKEATVKDIAEARQTLALGIAGVNDRLEEDF